MEGESDEALLGSVMQVPFEAPPLCNACLDDPRPRVPHLVELGAQLHKETLVFEREAGCARDSVEECGVFAQCCVVDERGDLPAMALEDRHRTPRGRNNSHAVSIHIHVFIRVADPVPELQ